MPLPAPARVETLLNHEGTSVSILLPTHRSGRELQQARIQLKNLLRDAAGRLDAAGMSAEEIEALLRPGHQLLADEGQWRSPEDGLAIYLAPDFAEHFTVPASLEPSLVVGSRFYVLPLLPLFLRHDHAFVLAMSINSVRLFAIDRFGGREVDLAGVPRSLTDAVGSDWEENAYQLHTVRPGSGGAIVHGHGVGQGEDDKQEATRFCLRVDAGLRRILLAAGNGTPWPLVIAAAEPLASIYAQASRYPNLVAEVVAGNPDEASGEDLRERAWTLLERRLADELAREVDRCRELLGTGRASTDTKEVELAAYDGRIDTLFVARGARSWGLFDPATREVEEAGDEPEGEELLNLAAVLTVRAGGKVHLVAPEGMPENASAAAVFRY